MHKTSSRSRQPATGPSGAPTSGEATSWLSLGPAALIYFALSLLYFLPAFAPGRQVFGTDYLGGGYMFYHFIGERLASGELPKWVPYVFGGMPLAANPGSTYHPVHFLADLILPTSKVLAVVFVAHFWIAGVGMYLLARELDCRRWISFVAGLAFQFTGITMSWVYAGHDGRIMVATMAPLFFYFLHRGVRTGGGLAPFAGASATLGFALLSFQIQNSYYLLLAAAIWAVFSLVHLGIIKRPAALGRTVALGLGAVAFGFLLAAVNFLPFLDYIPESPRGGEEGRGYEYSTSYSMPEAEILSLAVPEQAGVSVSNPETGRPLFPTYAGENGFKLHTEYVGVFAIVLLVLGFAYSRKDRYWLFFLALASFFLIIALGGNTPLYRVLYEVLPGTKRFRAPSLSFFVVALSLVSMAALTLEHLARLRSTSQQRLERLPWIAGGVAAVALLGAMLSAGGATPGSGTVTAAQGWMRFALFSGGFAVVLWLWSVRRLSSTTTVVLLALVTVADLWIIDRKFFHTVEGPEEMFAADDVVAYLESQPERSRVWAFPFPRPWRGAGAYGGNYPMLFGIDQAGGEHPNPLQRWVEYLGPGERSYIDWHNWVSEPAVVETPQGQAISFRSQPGFLAAANIRYIVSMAPLAHPGLREVYRGSALVYENVEALPRAYLVPEVAEAPAGTAMIDAMRASNWNPAQTAFVAQDTPVSLPATPLQGQAEIVEYSPDRIVVRTSANRAAFLVLADNFYQGWRATIDGTETPVVRANHTFRGVQVGEGSHEVIFEFRPDDLYLGLYVSLGGLLLLGGYGLFLLFRSRRHPLANAG